MNEALQLSLDNNAKDWVALSQTISTSEKAYQRRIPVNNPAMVRPRARPQPEKNQGRA